jgi:hypothetical protein
MTSPTIKENPMALTTEERIDRLERAMVELDNRSQTMTGRFGWGVRPALNELQAELGEVRTYGPRVTPVAREADRG